MDQARINPRDLPVISSQTKTTHIDRLQKILIESYDDRTIRLLDQHQRPHNVHYADGDFDEDGYWNASGWGDANYADGDWDYGYWTDQDWNAGSWNEGPWDRGSWDHSGNNQDDWNDYDWTNYDEEEYDDLPLENDGSVAYVEDYGFFGAT